MKKAILLILCVVLLIGCDRSNLEKELLELKSDYELLSEDNYQLTIEKKALFQKISDNELEKNTCEEEVRYLTEELGLLIDENKLLNNTLLEIQNSTIDTVAQHEFNLDVLSWENNILNYVFVPTEESYFQQVIVLGDTEDYDLQIIDKKPKIFGNDDIEGIDFVIKGKVYNFQWCNITWNDDYSEFDVQKVLESLEVVENQVVEIRTVLPEGPPYQMAQWENSEGQTFHQFLSYDGFGFEGTVMISN